MIIKTLAICSNKWQPITTWSGGGVRIDPQELKSTETRGSKKSLGVEPPTPRQIVPWNSLLPRGTFPFSLWFLHIHWFSVVSSPTWEICLWNASQLGLGESSFLLLEYSVKHSIEYSSTRQGVCASYSPAAVTQVKVTVRKAVYRRTPDS